MTVGEDEHFREAFDVGTYREKHMVNVHKLDV